MDLENSTLSAHLKIGSREAVVAALLSLDLARGVPVPVWPPRGLPYGLVISGVRNGWVSLWSPLENVREWFPPLTETLECPGVILEVIQSRFWIAELLRDGDFLGRMELPSEEVEYDDLWARTVESLEGEGHEQPWEDELRFGQRMDEIARSEEFREAVEHMHEERPEPDDLAPFLPPHARVEHAWDLLTAIDRRDAEQEEEDSPYADDYLEDFASYLGIRDAAWNMREDEELLSAGEYDEEEGLPDGWREFVVLPVHQLPVLE